MSKTRAFFNAFISIALFCGAVAAQKKERVEVVPRISAPAAGQVCREFIPGRATAPPKIIYPPAAKFSRVGGTVFVTVKIDEKGAVSEVEKISGQKSLQNAAADAAKKAKFVPAICDGAATTSSAALTYNFIPSVPAGRYFTPSKIEELIDLENDSPFYEAVSSLLKDYQLAFGFADKKFYADAPLTRGELAQFLRSTLDLLAARAIAANKSPREINLFYPHNPRKLSSVNAVKDLRPSEPFYDSVKTLLLKYDVALTDDKNEFRGSRYVTNNEAIDLWSKIFGAEAIPVNFSKIETGDPIISRGAFALFLQESLQVLTYKVLP